jgi:pyruvate formate lyase activating enzyme
LNKPNDLVISEEECLSFLDKRQGILDGICVTGGEPLLQTDISDFLYQVKNLGYDIKLDTNGSSPGRLKELVAKGLVDYVAMDIKSAPSHYAAAVGLKNFDFTDIKESVDFLLSEPVDYEFRTTVVNGLHDENILCATAAVIAGAKRYYLQKFVDSGDLIGTDLTAFTDNEMHFFLKVVSPFVQFAALRGL